LANPIPPWGGGAVWLTGASSGLGQALALEAACPGAPMILFGRDQDRLAETAGRCRALGAAAAAVALDFLDPDPEAPARAAARARELAGPVSLFVSCAGQGQRGLAAETDAALLERLLRVNFLGPAELTRLALPDMLRAGRGRVAAVSSLLAKFGGPRRSGYAAAKHALHGWFDSLRMELAGTGVGVSLLVPGWIKTDISRRAVDGGGQAHGRMDPGQERGLEPAEAARRVWRALRQGRGERLIGGMECAAAYGRRLLPAGWFYALLRRRGLD